MNRIRLCPCGKFAYLTAEDAHASLECLRKIPPKKHRKGRAPLSVYHCEHGFFHLTGMHPAQYARHLERSA